MMNRRTLLVAGAATLVTATRPARAQLYPTVEEVLFDREIPVIGNPDGDVTIAEFFDYQCPYCKRGHPELLNVVREDGNVRLVMKDWPIFGGPSVHAASLVLAAGPDYEAVHNALMATPGRLTKDEVNKTIANAGHDPEQLMANFKKDRQRIEGILSRNMDQANAFGFNGTPAFLFNTKMHYGAMRRNDIVAAIAEARG